MDRLPPHMILTLGRSGSNTLVDILNQNPEILNYGEVLGPWTWISRYRFLVAGFSNRPEAYADHLLYDRKIARLANFVRTIGKHRRGSKGDIKAFGRIRSLGIKEFSLNLGRYGLADHMLAKDDLRVIGLVRRSALDRLVSGRRLRETKEVLAREGSEAKRFQLELDTEKLIEELTIFQDEADTLDAMLDRVPDTRKYVVDYEDLYSDPERTFQIIAEIQAFLGVSDFKPSIRMKKLIQQPMSEVIGNYAQCQALVAGTRFARYFP